MPTRRECRHGVIQRFGGYAATVTSRTATTVVSDALKYRVDASRLQNWRVHFPQSDETDHLRLLSADEAYDPTTGTLTVGQFTAQPALGAVLELTAPDDPDPIEINTAISTLLKQTRRIVWNYLPSMYDAHEYPLVRLPWITSPKDVLVMAKRDSPNLVDNESFAIWGNSEGHGPARWKLSGADATVERATAFDGRAATLTRAGADANLTQELTTLRGQLNGRAVTASVRVLCATANRARISLADGVSAIATSDFHSGNGRWEELTVTLTANDDAQKLALALIVEDGDTNATFTRALVTEGEKVPEYLSRSGSDGYSIQHLRRTVFNSPTPTIFVRGYLQRGEQLAIASTQPFSPLASDEEETDCDLEAVVAGTISDLARRRRGGEDQTRWQELERIYRPIYNSWQKRFVQIPTPSLSTRQVVVRPA